MKILIFLFYFFFCLQLKVQSQCSITGKIIDETQTGLPDVTIRLLKNDSAFIAGTVTDSIGEFKFHNINSGKYFLSISSIGYSSIQKPIILQKDLERISPITLLSQNINLEEVTIKAHSFIRTKDCVLIIPNKHQVKHAATGYDLLYNLMIPNINVDRRNGRVSTLGGDVVLYIDGRKADYREIVSLRPIDIEKIEYHDVPTGKYANDIASINYITKKYRTGGYISLNGTQTIGYLKGDYNIVTKITSDKTSYTLFAGHSIEKYKDNKSENNETFYFPNYTINREYKTIDAKVKNDKQYVQLNIMNQNEKRTLLSKISLVHNNVPDNFQTDQMKYTGHYNLIQQSFSKTNQSNLAPTLNLYSNFNLGKKQSLETNIIGSYTNNIYNREYTENTFLSQTKAKEEFYNLDASINYKLEMKHQNSLTAQLYHAHKVSSSNYTGDYDYWQHLWTAESLVFLDYNQRIGKKFFFKIGPGVSALLYRLHGDNRISHISPRLRSLVTYQPQANQQLMATINIGNSFPQINTINRVDQNIDMLQIKRGNPNMDKANIYLAQLSYSLQYKTFNIQAIAYSINVNHAIVNNYYVEKDKLINSFSSNANYYNLIGMLTATWKVSEKLNFKMDGTWLQTKLTGTTSITCNNLIGSLQMNYYWKDFSLNLYGRTSQKTLDMSSISIYESGKYGASINWSHKNWFAEIGTENPFTPNHRKTYSINTNVYNFNNTNYSRIFQQTGYVKLSYTFDFGRKTSRSQEQVNTNINSAILKAQ